MLVLSRKPNQAILIEGGIEIKVISCNRGAVRIGVVAPGRQVLRDDAKKTERKGGFSDALGGLATRLGGATV